MLKLLKKYTALEFIERNVAEKKFAGVSEDGTSSIFRV
jgi:hypothetical protein